MKLRQKPEDFIVEEINDFDILKKGDYKLYTLEKKGIETFFLLSHLSKNNNIPANEFGIAGMKDKHALTRQYFTLPSRYEIKTLHEPNMKIKFIGYVGKKINLGDLKENRFEITVRDLRRIEVEGMDEKLNSIEKIGVPNYFDSQRFGSVINKTFIAKYILKKNYGQAAKIFLTQFTRHENSRIKQEKKLILQHWDNLQNIRVKTGSLRRVIGEYKKTNSWLEAYKKIPFNLRDMFNSAYQSYLWNECIKETLKSKLPKENLYSVKYNAGSMLFYRELTEDEIKSVSYPLKTISADIRPNEFEKKIIDDVLKKEGVSVKEFDIRQETGNFYSTNERAAILKPTQIKASPIAADELNGNGKRLKVTLSFALPKGSYATIITKRIFNK